MVNMGYSVLDFIEEDWMMDDCYKDNRSVIWIRIKKCMDVLVKGYKYGIEYERECICMGINDVGKKVVYVVDNKEMSSCELWLVRVTCEGKWVFSILYEHGYMEDLEGMYNRCILRVDVSNMFMRELEYKIRGLSMRVDYISVLGNMYLI